MGRQRQRRSNCHHLGMHRQCQICICATAVAAGRCIGRMRFVLPHGFLVQDLACNLHAPVLQSTAIETWTIVVETLANDFAATDNDAAMAVVQGRFRCLLETERHVGILTWRHSAEIRVIRSYRTVECL
jgi:hypothetical protein